MSFIIMMAGSDHSNVSNERNWFFRKGRIQMCQKDDGRVSGILSTSPNQWNALVDYCALRAAADNSIGADGVFRLPGL